MKRTLLISSIVAVLSGGSALYGQVPPQPPDSSVYSQDAVDAAMAKLLERQALREAQEASMSPEQRAAEQHRRDREEILRLRRDAQAAQRENDALRRQVAQMTRELVELRQSMEQLSSALQDVREAALERREVPAYPIYVYDRYPRSTVSPLTVIPPVWGSGSHGPVFDRNRPAPTNALNPARTPRNTLNPSTTPRNTMRPGLPTSVGRGQ